MHRVDEFTFGKSSEIFAQSLDEMLSDMDERCRVSAERKNKRRLAWIIDVSSRSSHFHVFGNGKIISKNSDRVSVESWRRRCHCPEDQLIHQGAAGCDGEKVDEEAQSESRLQGTDFVHITSPQSSLQPKSQLPGIDSDLQEDDEDEEEIVVAPKKNRAPQRQMEQLVSL